MPEWKLKLFNKTIFTQNMQLLVSLTKYLEDSGETPRPFSDMSKLSFINKNFYKIIKLKIIHIYLGASRTSLTGGAAAHESLTRLLCYSKAGDVLQGSAAASLRGHCSVTTHLQDR